jgi:hypothetical protein
MLTLEPSEEYSAVAELARVVGLEMLSPAARDAEAAKAVPATVWKSVLDTGLTVPVAEERGGSGMPDTMTYMAAIENLAYGDPGIAVAAAWSGAAAMLLGRHGSQAQDAVLSRLITDPDARGSVAFYEGFGRAPGEYDTKVTVAGGQVTVAGRKVAVPFAGQASDIIVVGSDATSGRLRAVLVPSGTPGVVVEQVPGGLALNAAALASVSFDVTVAEENLLGGPDADSSALGRSIETIRLIIAAALIGTAQRAVEYAAQYATERVAFGRPIAGFQGVSFPLADGQMRVAALRLELRDICSRLDAEPFEDVSAAVTGLIGYAGEACAEATRTAVQTLGGHGFLTDHPVEIWYRSAAALAILDFDVNRSSFQAAL